MAHRLVALLLVSGLLLAPACKGRSKHGKRLQFGKLEIFYKKPVTKASVQRLGKWLEKEEFNSEDRKASLQLLKPRGRWQFRMVVREGYDKNKRYHVAVRNMADKMSREVFDGQPVDVHLCDDKFKTLTTLAYQKIHRVVFGKSEVRYEAPMTKADAQRLGDLLVKGGFFKPERKISVKIDRLDGRIRFHVVLLKGAEKNPRVVPMMRAVGQEISAKAFGGKPVDVILTDAAFQKVQTIRFESGAPKPPARRAGD